tara:strand:+ start:1066 stop:1818 length:753 start_codon:yes stop_codon:yes gene_type:complete
MGENLPSGQAGKFNKYFLYAIGEIILVVIGILIALSINNWNEERQQNSKTESLIAGLKKQTEENLVSTNWSIKQTKQVNKDIASLLLMFGKPIEKSQHSNIDSLVNQISFDFYSYLNLSTLQEAQDNGEISFIKNDSLKFLLYNTSSISRLIKEREKVINNDKNTYLVPFLYQNINRKNIQTNTNEKLKNKIGESLLNKNDYSSLLSNTKFENLVLSRYNYSEDMIGIYESLKKFLNDLLELLEGESLNK